VLDKVFDKVNVPQAVFDEVIIPCKPEAEILRNYLEGKIVNIEQYRDYWKSGSTSFRQTERFD
jgi:hypothetical protein